MLDSNSRFFLLILSLWCISSFGVLAQTTLNIQTYIQERVQQLDNIPNHNYSDNKFEAGWVDGMDIRTETDEFKFNRQRYLFRVSPSTPKIRAAQTNLHQLNLEKADLQQTLLKKDFIEIAYDEVLTFYEAFRKLKIKEDLLIILEDKEQVWRKLSLTTNKIPTDWIKVQQEIAQLEIDIFKEKTLLESWQREGVWLNWENLLPVDSILEKIDLSNSKRFQLQAREYDVDNLIIEREEALEQAEQKKLLDFVQIEYNGPHTDNLKEKVALTAGFRLPFSSSRKLKMEEIAIEKEILQQERMVEKKLSLYKEKKRKQQLELLIGEWSYAKNKFAQQGQEMLNFAENAQNTTNNTLLFLLLQKEINIERALDILKLEIAIYQSYIDYLTFTEELYLPVFHQFLSKLKL
ncbi:MAG: hypothetical protein AB8G86_19660 [Saprospiraceae bacterium]